MILLASILFTAGTLNLLANPPLGPGERPGPDGSPDVAQWIVALFAIGVLASLVFGLGPLVAASVVATLVEVAGGSPQPVVFLILAAAALVTVGMALALQRTGH